MRHTKGPWKWAWADFAIAAEGWEIDNPREKSFKTLWSVSENKPVFIARDASDYTASCEFKNENDRCLITAAPDLLEASEALLNDVRRRYPEIEAKGFSCPFFRAIEQAVKKAKGE